MSQKHPWRATSLRYIIYAVEDAIKDGRSVDLGIGHLSPTISTISTISIIAADTADTLKP